MRTMKAMCYERYGSPDNLVLREIDIPTVTDDELLVRVRAAGVNWLDWHFLTGRPLLVRFLAGLRRPRQDVLGIDVAGCVEAVGPNVTQFRPGDEVFGAGRHGCFATYAVLPEAGLVAKPANLTFVEAAGVPAAASTALHALVDTGLLRAKQKVLINGASGGVGTFAVQIAKALGADVTAVCSTPNLELARSLGATRVIDYTHQDFARGNERYDLILDVAATRSFAECRRALAPQGTYVTSAFSPALVIRARWLSLVTHKRLAPLPPQPPSQQDLVLIRELLATRKIIPLIDRCYPLHELPDALRYLAKGHTRGKVIIVN